MNAELNPTSCGKNFLDAFTASCNILTETHLDIRVASINQLKTHESAELRKLWVHGVHADTNAVGWLPTSVFDTRARSDEVTAVYRNRELVGWCLRGESYARKVMKIYQVWVRPDARVLEHGRALITNICHIAINASCHILEAWVAEDLAANVFWNAIGFTRGVWRWGRGKSLRKIYRWTTVAEKRGKETTTAEDWRGINYYDANERRQSQHCGTV